MSEEGKTLTLYTHKPWTCPYHQRIWIALLEKGLLSETRQVDVPDPWSKPPELLQVNPRGLVPALVHRNRSIPDSSIIVNYLDEAFPDRGRKLTPSHPYERAVVRLWTGRIEKEVACTYYSILLQSKDEEKQVRSNLWRQLIHTLKDFAESMDEAGPFFFGSSLSTIDILMAPYAIRYHTVYPHYFPRLQIRADSLLDIDKSLDQAWLPRYQRWLNEISEHPSVRATIPSDISMLVKSYERYIQGTLDQAFIDNVKKGILK